MSDQTSAPEAQTADAVDTLVARLEHEHAWHQELTDDLAETERNISRLTASVISGCELLPLSHRRDIKRRCAKLALAFARQGRPPSDLRQATVLEFLAAHIDLTVTNAQVRLHLTEAGIPHGPKYVSNLLSGWAAEGMLTRLSHGVFRVNPGDSRLLAVGRAPSDPAVRKTIDREKLHRYADHVANDKTPPSDPPPPALPAPFSVEMTEEDIRYNEEMERQREARRGQLYDPDDI